MNQEVELTARLTEVDFKRLKKVLTNQFRQGATQKRFMIRFFRDKVNVRESLDVRYKWTDGVNQLVIKKGALGTAQREEIIVDLGKVEQLSSFVRIFQLLGYKTGDAIYREIDRFVDDQVELALVAARPYYFLEIEALGAKGKRQALSTVQETFNQLDLEPLDKASYQTFKRLLDREVNLIFPLSEFPKPLLNHPNWKRITQQTIFSNNSDF